MKKIYLFGLVSLMAVTSCIKDNLYNDDVEVFTLNATVEENLPSTKVGFDLDNNGAFFWNKGDAIAVGSESLTKYTTSDSDGSTSATFTGYSAASGYAIYPYSCATAINGTALTYTFEDSYTYTAVDNDFFSGMSVDMPMWAPVAGNTLSFKHLGGIFAFKFPNLKKGEGQTFTMTADKKISGVYTVDMSGDDPQFEATAAGSDDEKMVTVDFSLDSDSDAVFYVPVPVGTYEITVTILNGDESFSTSWKNLKVDRRDIRYTTLSAHSLQGAEAKVVESASDVTDAMEESTNVVVSEVSGEEASIEIPKKEDGSAVHSLSINAIAAETQVITIAESEGEGSSIEELVISVPSLEDAKKLVVDMPSTTVTIAVNGMGTMTLAEVTAATAENTLIVENNVNITKLIVNAGNVRVKKGATISEIVRGEENNEEDTYLIYEEGAVIPQNPDGITLVEAATYDLINFLSSATSGTYTLTGDVTVPANTVIPEGVTIDGAGFEVTTDCTVEDGVGKGVFQLAGTIKNLNFVSPNTQYDIIVTAASTIENCNFPTATNETMGKGKRAIFTGAAAVSGDLNVKDCVFDDKVYAFNFSTAANTMDIAFEGCTLGGWLSGHGKSHTFTDCTFKSSGDYANYVPYCSAEFKSCTFENGFEVSLAAAGNYGAKMVFDASSTYNGTVITKPADVSWDLSGDSTGIVGKTVTITIGSTTYTAKIGENETITWAE